MPDARVLLDLLRNHRHRLRPLPTEVVATRQLAGLSRRGAERWTIAPN